MMWPKQEVVLSVGCFVFCSSVALVSNKMVMQSAQAPASVFCTQIAVTVVFIVTASSLRLIEVDKPRLDTIVPFMPFIGSFVLCLYANGKALAVSNLETVIVFRACAPLCISVMDWLFLGRELPSARSTLALAGLVGGAVTYVYLDGEFKLHGCSAYTWVTLNLIGMVFDMTYGKRLISDVGFRHPVWSSSFHANFLAFLPMLGLAGITGEATAVREAEANNFFGSWGFFWLIVSTIVGTGLSWSGWTCRQRLSATSYSMIGVVCKFLSIALHTAVAGSTAGSSLRSPGFWALSICLISSACYEQAPLRTDGDEKKAIGSSDKAKHEADMSAGYETFETQPVKQVETA